MLVSQPMAEALAKESTETDSICADMEMEGTWEWETKSERTLTAIEEQAAETIEETEAVEMLSAGEEQAAESETVSDSSESVEAITETETLYGTQETEEETFQETAAEEEAPTSGTCGVNLTWRLEDGTLMISGTGAMYDYAEGFF